MRSGEFDLGSSLMSAGGLTVLVNGIALQLLAGGGVYDPSAGALFVADLHLGKDTTFRKHGVPVPIGSATTTLNRVTQLIDRVQPERLYFLGDMFHARSSLSPHLIDQVDGFCKQHSEVAMTLIRGNHEASFRDLPSRWSIELIEEELTLGPLLLCHHPVPPKSSAMISLAGHIHPSYRFQSKTDHLGRVPCFWYTEQTLVLPAIGQFTGTFKVSPGNADRVWLNTGEAVFEVPLNSR